MVEVYGREVESRHAGYGPCKDQEQGKQGGVYQSLGTRMNSLVAPSVDFHCNGSLGRELAAYNDRDQGIFEAEEVLRDAQRALGR